MVVTLNERTYSLLYKLKEAEQVEAFEFETPEGRVTLLDVGVKVKISDKEIGKKVAKASMGGIGKVKISDKVEVEIPTCVAIATLSCQLAGWGIKIKNQLALGSGPARILAKKPEKIIREVGYYEESDQAALILETDTLPSKEICGKILKETNADSLIIAAFKGHSLTGLINVLARIVEVGVFRLNRLGFNVEKIKSAQGEVPLSKPEIFSTNEAIIYSGEVFFKVESWNPELTEKVVSKSSKAYGKPFRQIFEEAGKDFYQIPPDIFAPAKVTIFDLEKVKEYQAGEVRRRGIF